MQLRRKSQAALLTAFLAQQGGGHARGASFSFPALCKDGLFVHFVWMQLKHANRSERRAEQQAGRFLSGLGIMHFLWSLSSEGWGWERAASVLIFRIWMEEMFKRIHGKVRVDCRAANYWAGLLLPGSTQNGFLFLVRSHGGGGGEWQQSFMQGDFPTRPCLDLFLLS